MIIDRLKASTGDFEPFFCFLFNFCSIDLSGDPADRKRRNNAIVDQ